ncbi:MAG: hypothetical protein GF332_03695 [Candidatus Moranbacteria bacterium]|nr:hypothetical protein [Candidatus Moranbacteria bacterium]
MDQNNNQNNNQNSGHHREQAEGYQVERGSTKQGENRFIEQPPSMDQKPEMPRTLETTPEASPDREVHDFEKEPKQQSSVRAGQVQAQDEDEYKAEEYRIMQMEKDQQISRLVQLALTRDEGKAVNMAKKVFGNDHHSFDKFHDVLMAHKQS